MQNGIELSQAMFMQWMYMAFGDSRNSQIFGDIRRTQPFNSKLTRFTLATPDEESICVVCNFVQ